MKPVVTNVVAVAADVGMRALDHGNERDRPPSYLRQTWECIPSVASLPLQACRPSIHVCSTFALPPLPHILNQVPPGAQQLTLPDFAKVPHWGHVIGDITTDAATVDEVDVVYTACIALFKLVMGVDDKLLIAVDDVVPVHSVRGIDPGEYTNILFFHAVEWTQELPQSFRLNDSAPQNMYFMVLTCDTCHFRMSALNDVASLNM